MTLPVPMEWRLRKEDPALACSISRKLEIGMILARSMVARGVTSIEQAYDLLNPNLRRMHDPYLMRNMSRIVERVRSAVEGSERVLIHGDYDVDGITSTALLYSFLKDSYPDLDIHTYLPSRFGDGYGLSENCIKNEIEKGTDLLITVDCGIKAVDQIDMAAGNGMDVIITDHHEPGEEIPRAFAVLDPKVQGTAYPFRDLAGVGVALKLAHAITLAGDVGTDIRDYMDLATIGTIADMVPLTDENRLICHFGLERLASTSRVGLRALMRESGMDLTRPVTSTDVGFRLAPRLNSAGRLGHPDLALDLLLTKDRVDSDLFSRELTTLNYKRQAIGKKLVDDILKEIDSGGMENDPSIVVSGEEWNPGVIGISASRIMDAMGRPVIVLSEEGKLARGSGRGPKGFDLVKALESMSHLFMEFGGHKRAAGLTMRSDLIDDLREGFNSYMELKYPDQVFRPVLDVDLDLLLEELDIDSIQELEMIGPFGAGNPTVQISIRGVTVGNDLKAVGEGKHLKFTVEDDTSYLSCIWFNSGEAVDEMVPGTLLDISGQPDIHRWRGDVSVQLKVTDVHVLDG
ncbi:MAG: single-stranded-DNA-specific exonuclease RecJ [Thermoplasmatota archaeon]